MSLYKIKKDVYYKYVDTTNFHKNGSLVNVDGDVSGFSTSNYVIIRDFNPGANTWRITLNFTTSDDVSTTQQLIGGSSSKIEGLEFGIASGKFKIWLGSGTSSYNIANGTVGSYIIQPNTNYYVVIMFLSSAYIVYYSVDGGEMIQDIFVLSSTAIYGKTKVLGVDLAQSQAPFLGSINMKKSSIYINDELWWSGYKKIAVKSTPEEYDFVQTEEAYKCVSKKEYEYFKYGTTPNVITFGYVNNDKGVLSGFSASDYVTLPYIFSSDSFTWEVMLKIKTSTLSSSTSDNNLFIGGTSAFKSGVAIYCESKVLKLSLSSNGSSWDIAKTKTGSTLSSDTDYYIRLRFTGTEYELSYRTLDSDWNIDIVVSSTTPVLQNSTWLIGSGYIGGDTRYTATGGIDFKECYIDINGERWWNGVKLEECTVNDNYYTKIISDKYFNMSEDRYMYATFIGAGLYSITVAKDGEYLIEAVSGGGCGGYSDGGNDKYSDTAYAYHYYSNGGSGAYFKGYIHLTAGTHYIDIGNANKTQGGYGAHVKIGDGFELSGGLNGLPALSTFLIDNTGTGGKLTNETNVASVIDYRAGSDRVYHGRWKDNNGKAFDNTPSVAPGNLQQYGYAGGRQSKVIQFGGGAYLSIRYNYGEII